ncbi:MAG: esterase [Balneolaceae bacterium]|nr:esterase [Balneolaceae bacterium]
MRTIILLVLAAVISSNTAFAQPDIDYTVPLKSEYLQSQENIQVYLPKSYHQSDKKYPVLYILDGQWYFLNGVAIQETLRGDGLMPEMIVIGVDYKSRAYHDSLHFNHWAALSNYIEEELIEFVDQNYRTNNERIVFGWENPSYMVCEFLFQEKPTFSGFISSNGGYVNDEMLEAFNAYHGKQLYLFVANSRKDIYTVNSSNELAETLRTNTPDQLTWHYELFNEETHESLAYTSLYQGLRYYYHNYSSKVFSDAKEFFDEGGIEALEKYFQERSERFGTDPAIDASTKNSLIWLAWRTDDFRSFKYFMEEFDDVLSTRRYASAYWQNRLGQFYLKSVVSDKR